MLRNNVYQTLLFVQILPKSALMLPPPVCLPCNRIIDTYVDRSLDVTYDVAYGGVTTYFSFFVKFGKLNFENF